MLCPIGNHVAKNNDVGCNQDRKQLFHNAFSFLLFVAMGNPAQGPVNHEIIGDFHPTVMNKCLGQGLHDSSRAATRGNDIDWFVPAHSVFQTTMHHHQRATNGVHHAADSDARRRGWEWIYLTDGAVEVGGSEHRRLFHQVETRCDGATGIMIVSRRHVSGYGNTTADDDVGTLRRAAAT